MELEKAKIVVIYQKLQQELMSNIIKQIEKTGNITSYTKRQIKTFINIGGKDVFLNNLKALNSITEAQKKAVEEIYTETAKEIMKEHKKEYEYREIPFEFSNEQKQILNASIKRTNKELKNLTKSVAFNSKQTYIKAIDNLYLKVVTGGVDYNTAVKSTVNELTEKGIVLKSKGREYKLESAVKMNLRTSLTQITNEISEEVGKDIGADGVWIAPTPSCRPTHRVINGVEMSNKEFKKYKYLTEEPNCQHIVMPIIMGVFENPYTKSELSKLKKYSEDTYEQQQKQNYYARQVRYKKQEIATLNKSDKRVTENQELLEKKKIELRNAQMKYRTYSKANNLQVDYDKTWTSGYNK